MRTRALTSTLQLFRDAATGWWQDDVPRLAASLSYYTLFAIAPILVVAITIAGFVFGADAVRAQVVAQMDALLGHVGAAGVQGLLEGASHPRVGVLATIVGSVTLLITATGAFLELQASLNRVWCVKPDPNANIPGFIANRAKAFGLMVAIGFLLLVSLAVSTALAALGKWFGSSAFGSPAFWWTANIVISLTVITVLFMLLFKVLPDVHLRWRDVWAGSLVTAVLFTIGKELIGLYLGQGSVATSYGAAASVVVLLLWVYYASMIVLYGAEFVRVHTIRKLGHRPPTRIARKKARVRHR